MPVNKKAVAKAAVKKAATKLIRRAGPVGVATTLYDFYKRGQKKSGGKVRKNPSLEIFPRPVWFTNAEGVCRKY